MSINKSYNDRIEAHTPPTSEHCAQAHDLLEYIAQRQFKDDLKLSNLELAVLHEAEHICWELHMAAEFPNQRTKLATGGSTSKRPYPA